MLRIRELNSYICRPTMPVRGAMARLNASDQLFQLIVSEDGALLGTLTDGDIRRALLRGVALDAPVEECMHTQFIAARAGDALNEALSGMGARGVNFLPVVDDKGKLVEVMVSQDQRSSPAHALVMAGGFGRRLGERTVKTPKPLLPIGEKSILDHLLINNNFGIGANWIGDIKKNIIE